MTTLMLAPPYVTPIPPLPSSEQNAHWNERARRSILRVMRHEAADTLHADALAEAIRDANTLATTTDDLAAAIILANPDPFAAMRVQMIRDTESPDEAAATLSAIFDRLVEPIERGMGLACSGVEMTLGGTA